MYKSDFYKMKDFSTAANQQQTATPGVPDKNDDNATAGDTAAAPEILDLQVVDDANKQEHREEASVETALKHPLQNTWTLWYLENDRTKSWADMQNEVTSFDTVEDFWSLYNHIKPPSEIKLGGDYSLFKKGVRPMWEDAANKQGGRWLIALNKFPKSEVNSVWLDVLLCLIGEAFDHSDEICGAVINIRGKGNKISVWTAHGNNREAVLEIGYKLRDTLHMRHLNLNYQLHKDSITKEGPNVKYIYSL